MQRTLFLVGDSTVSNYTIEEESDRIIPRNGYGMHMQQYFNNDIIVKNLALSGRSSKSFLSEMEYTILKNEIKAGDFLLIAFGHNDEKPDAARFSSAKLGKDVEGSYKWFLNEKYIKLALSKGAEPILCNSIVRRSENGYVGVKVHNTETGDYAEAVRELGKEVKVCTIDVTMLTKELYESMTLDETKKLQATEPNKNEVDNTHLNSYGASIIAGVVTKAIKKSNSELAKFVK